MVPQYYTMAIFLKFLIVFVLVYLFYIIDLYGVLVGELCFYPKLIWCEYFLIIWKYEFVSFLSFTSIYVHTHAVVATNLILVTIMPLLNTSEPPPFSLPSYGLI